MGGGVGRGQSEGRYGRRVGLFEPRTADTVQDRGAALGAGAAHRLSGARSALRGPLGRAVCRLLVGALAIVGTSLACLVLPSLTQDRLLPSWPQILQALTELGQLMESSGDRLMAALAGTLAIGLLALRLHRIGCGPYHAATSGPSKADPGTLVATWTDRSIRQAEKQLRISTPEPAPAPAEGLEAEEVIPNLTDDDFDAAEVLRAGQHAGRSGDGGVAHKLFVEAVRLFPESAEALALASRHQR